MRNNTLLQEKPKMATWAIDRYELREVRSESELGALLNFRYDCFRASHLGSLVSQNNDRLDLDCYDVNAHHFALVAMLSDGRVRLVGCARFVGDSRGPLGDAVIRMAHRHPGIAPEPSVATGMPLPCLQEFPEAYAFYNACKARGERVVEPSRLAIASRIRSMWIGPLMVYGLTAFWYARNIDTLMLQCMPRHARFYATIGFRETPGTSLKFVAKAQADGVCLTMSRDTIAPAVLPKIQDLAEMLTSEGLLQFPRAQTVTSPKGLSNPPMGVTNP